MNQIISQQFKQLSNTLFQNNQESNMAFINELVSEEQKTKLDIEVFYNPNLTLYKQMEFYRWVVDYERDLFLLPLGGGGPWEGEGYPRPPEYFAFSYKGEVIKFETTYRYEDAGDGDYITYVEVQNIKTTERLEQNNELKILLTEALEAFGDDTGHRETVRIVLVTFK